MSDALERLRNRQRPEVPVRNSALTSKSLDPSVSGTLDTSIPGNQESEISRTPDLGIEELVTKQSTMRLEADISDRLQAACRAYGLSREVLIEALFLHCEGDSKAWQAVVDEARKRADHRQQIANLRRAHSMMQKFGAS